MEIIIDRTDLVTPKYFAELVCTDPVAVDRAIKARELNCEVITEGRTRRVYVNLEMFLNRAQAEGLTAPGMFKRLSRRCKK